MLASIMSLCVYKRIQIDVEISTGLGSVSRAKGNDENNLDTFKPIPILIR